MTAFGSRVTTSFHAQKDKLKKKVTWHFYVCCLVFIVHVSACVTLSFTQLAMPVLYHEGVSLALSWSHFSFFNKQAKKNKSYFDQAQLMFSPCALIHYRFREINYSLKNCNHSFWGWLSAYLFYPSHSFREATLTLYIKPMTFPLRMVDLGNYGTDTFTIWLSGRPRYVGDDWGVLQSGFCSWELWDPRRLWDRHRGGRTAKPSADDSYFSAPSSFPLVGQSLTSWHAHTHTQRKTRGHKHVCMHRCRNSHTHTHTETWRQSHTHTHIPDLQNSLAQSHCIHKKLPSQLCELGLEKRGVGVIQVCVCVCVCLYARERVRQTDRQSEVHSFRPRDRFFKAVF